jgi:hypothetical protein
MLATKNLGPGRQLTPDDLREIGEALFGPWGWQTRLAEVLEVDGSTVRRWVSGAVSIPQPVKVALRLMLERREVVGAALPEPPAREKQPARPRSTTLASKTSGRST